VRNIHHKNISMRKSSYVSNCPTLVSVSVSVDIFMAVRETPKDADGVKAAAEPTSRGRMVNFIFGIIDENVITFMKL